jgi:transcriptional regulator with XRE-family HTH domain
MLPDEIKKLRDELGCSIGELSEAVGVDVKTLLEWEAGDRFPTKRHADKLQAVRLAGPGAIKRKPRGKKQQPTGVALLADPRLWTIVRKLVTHPDLVAEVERLAEKYDDPTPPKT